MTRDHLYKLLRQIGHEPCKALEIALDYERGDEYAKMWVDAALSWFEKKD